MAKWIFDRTMSLVGLLFLWPVLIIIAVAIKVTSVSEPVVYKQVRIGRFAKPFTIYKFRTMKTGHQGSTISVKGESRITPIGEFLRKYKLDELLELWNVLIGDMSFVGPRPDVPGYADKLEGDSRKILELRPGITGPASIKYKNEEQLLAKVSNPIEYNNEVIYPDKVKINLDYYENHTLIGDIKLIIKTFV
ncbi:MAG: sugar transferase [Salinivirgaceae bacterium]|nr:sugar transferase [Salinivirgaceae bacterium]